MFGLFGALATRAMQPKMPDVIAEIPRNEFDAVESPARRMIVFHSKGEGYAHVSFVAYSRTPLENWERLMRHWADGLLGAGPIPVARLVER